jgi:hypothetical protein
MDRQTLRDWVHCYNAEGLAGLSDRPHGGGPARRLTAEQAAAVAKLVRAGPSAAEHGVVRWRRVGLAAVIAQRFGITYSLEREPLGTMGPLRLMTELPEQVLIMNGDVLTDLDYGAVLRGHVVLPPASI